MALKTLVLTIADEGRDKGKRFLLTEMPAYRGIKWADKCLLAMAAAGATLPNGALGSGVLGLLAAGVTSLSGLRYEVAEPLLDELMGCVQFMPTPTLTFPLILGDGCQVEEVATFWTLRVEIFKLMTGFSLAANGPSTAPQA